MKNTQKEITNSDADLTPYMDLIKQICVELRECPTLVIMVMHVWRFIRQLGGMLLKQEIDRRARQPESWRKCPCCGYKLESKGFQKRQILTLFGLIKWERRIGRCSNRCHGSQEVPLDARLGLHPYQQVSEEIRWMSCMLSIFVPFETASQLFQKIMGIKISPNTLWRWTQELGKRIKRHLDAELQALKNGKFPELEVLTNELENAPLIVSADGVMVPMRPAPSSAAGKTEWREVKVGILARYVKRITRKGKEVFQLQQRRLVAVLGNIEIFSPMLRLEALRQGILKAEKVLWICDGAKGFWGIFEEWRKLPTVSAILDFYHAAENLGKAAKAWLDGRTKACREWFRDMRHKLRHGHETAVVSELKELADSKKLPISAVEIIRNVYHYLSGHIEHIHYHSLKESLLPIGSGLVESACKWLIQQRFKGVGMRWSEEGFASLLYLRLAWVNGRYNDFFTILESEFEPVNR